LVLLQIGVRRGNHKLVWGGADMVKKEEGPYGKYKVCSNFKGKVLCTTVKMVRDTNIFIFKEIFIYAPRNFFVGSGGV
jgi:hypothetical protein